MTKTSSKPEDFIVPLNMNGLKGRMLYAPTKNKKHNREILVIYGHHAMLERWWGLVENLQAYGNVCMPDLPGFGGMDSLYKIGRKPDFDAYADYLAAFIKLRYKRRRVSIYAISFGFVIITRMLQKYPELSNKIDILVSSVGFMKYDDFHWKPWKRFIFKMIARFFATRGMSFLIRYVGLNKFVIKTLTQTLPHSKHRFIEVTPLEFEETMNFEVKLWHANDVRTHWATTRQFLTLDNTKKRVNLPVYHITSETDHYFNNISVEQHMRGVFKDYKSFIMNTKAHTPHVTADKKAMTVMLPKGLRQVFNKQ
jgi:pimeloyl-ACP methyl ester carboxylesterase